VAISYCQLNSHLFWEPRYIAAAWTRITGNTSRDCYCCVTSPRITENTSHDPYTCVTSPCMPCIAAIHAQTQRKHFHSIVAWRVCWDVFTGLLPSNALSKSVTILMFSMQIRLHCVTYCNYISDSLYLEICHLKAKSNISVCV
jgi:hypothetical protein